MPVTKTSGGAATIFRVAPGVAGRSRSSCLVAQATAFCRLRTAREELTGHKKFDGLRQPFRILSLCCQATGLTIP